MTDKLEAKANAGKQAASLMAQEPIRKAFKDLEAEYIRMMVQTDVDNVRQRDVFHTALKVLGDVGRHLSMMIGNGKIAQAALDKLVRQQAKR